LQKATENYVLGQSDNHVHVEGPDELIAQLGSAVATGDREQIIALATALVDAKAGQSATATTAADGALLTLHQVAAALGVSSRTVWRLAASRDLAPPVRVRRACRWTMEDVRAYIARIRTAQTRNRR